MVTQIMGNGWRIYRRLGALLLPLIAFVPPAHTATQGALGATSTATLDISLVINPMIQVSQVQDISLTTLQGEYSRGSSPVCVSGNYDGEFQLEVQGSGDGNDLALSSGDVTVAYQVLLQDESSEFPLQALSPSPALPLEDCAVASRNVVVDVAAEDTAAAQPGVYTGTLTLVVVPD